MTYVGQLVDSLLAGRSVDSAHQLMQFLISGEATDAQIAGILVALKSKGVSASELAGFARALDSAADRINHNFSTVVDSCGTGGGLPTFNVSTAAAIVAAAAGAKVAKHGNRAVTSSCGSADVLEALGVRLEQTCDRQREIFSTCGLIFMFAPHHHPAMRHVAKVRRELGTRTVFNLLGPLVNPASATVQLIGVYDRELLQVMADAAVSIGCERVLCVHGADGLDEISPGARTYGVYGDASGTQPFDLEPLYPEAHLAPGQTVEENALILKEAISDAGSPRCLAILPSAGAVLWLAGLADSIQAGALLARAIIADGAAARKLDEFVEASRQ